MTSAHYHEIIDYLRRVTEASQWENHVFTVGGCCRDEILGHEIKDVDLAVDLPGGGIGFARWLYEKGLALKEPVTFPSFGTAPRPDYCFRADRGRLPAPRPYHQRPLL